MVAETEDYSAAATVVGFDPPISLLRGPVPASSIDDPSKGDFVLAFKDERSWRRAFQASEAKLREQCEAGARVGCSIGASTKCRPSWWQSLFRSNAVDFSERERCEEREMAACLDASKEACIQFAKDKCLPVFRDARIASKNHKHGLESMLLGSEIESATNYRGSVLLGCEVERSCKERQDLAK
ncbi:uncharacterized protein LOC18423975 isoform X1 [Amborella trichopoda]|uniref:uncharacterized protein LOC18423975 isoform X1 n=1 Tax=Amborella trichopoda TaxID=13333 RepID=UPI0005D3A35B|nr:uncharacterized protein LOC18423975 isoform X1 [Amborella trichopoda]|eukprot:XP_011628526.1 uncharacterized protein LOC18423975 isoform X1 [Amborella trichopoda]